MWQVLRGCDRIGQGHRGQITMIFAAAAAYFLIDAVPCIGAAQAQSTASLPPGPELHSKSGGVAQPTLAWTEFCGRLPDECAINLSEPALISLTSAIWEKMVAINVRVNRTITPMTDQQHWGVEDHWDYPDDGFGDCEDYQLLKRKLLAEAGLPRRAMRMTVVLDEQGAGHAVLTVRTDQGDFILDNKRDAVLPWTQTGYSYIKREGSDDLAWVSLNGRASPVATANR